MFERWRIRPAWAQRQDVLALRSETYVIYLRCSLRVSFEPREQGYAQHRILGERYDVSRRLSGVQPHHLRAPDPAAHYRSGDRLIAGILQNRSTGPIYGPASAVAEPQWNQLGRRHRRRGTPARTLPREQLHPSPRTGPAWRHHCIAAPHNP